MPYAQGMKYGSLDISLALTEEVLQQADDMVRRAAELEEQARMLRMCAAITQGVAETARDAVRQFVTRPESEGDERS